MKSTKDRFFDYDGTTVDDTDNIRKATKKTIESLGRLKENGYLTMLCSGAANVFWKRISINLRELSPATGPIRKSADRLSVIFTFLKRRCRRSFSDIIQKDTALHMETQDVTYYMHYDRRFTMISGTFLDFRTLVRTVGDKKGREYYENRDKLQQGRADG